MVEIIRNIIKLIAQFTNYLYNLKIDFIGGEKVLLGHVVVAFIFLIVIIYLILSAIGLNFGGDE